MINASDFMTTKTNKQTTGLSFLCDVVKLALCLMSICGLLTQPLGTRCPPSSSSPSNPPAFPLRSECAKVAGMTVGRDLTDERVRVDSLHRPNGELSLVISLNRTSVPAELFSHQPPPALLLLPAMAARRCLCA